MNFLADHLWQSTLFAGIVWLLTLALRRNGARVRHWLWFAASIKFLIPFSLFIALGSLVPRRAVPAAVPSKVYVVMDQVSQPFTAPAVVPVMPPAPSPLPAILLSVWALGFIGITCAWWVRWRRIRSAVRAGSPLHLELSIQVRSSPTLFEPGIFGIFRPTLLLPEGIFNRLTLAQLRAVIAHELCHVRHRDNLIATIHMFVETVFWFHPLVWWIGKRMVEERERACDEEVLRLFGEPQAYAEGILNVCKLYLESPLTCISGVTGSNLKKRIETIMTRRVAHKLNFSKRALLTAAGIVAVVGPVVVGQNTVRPAFDVASVKSSTRPREAGSTAVNPQGIDYNGATLRMILAEAYGVKWTSISSPDARISEMLDQGTYSIVAKADHPVPKEQLMLMLQTLLADRFKVTLHRESKVEPVYKLAVAKNGPKLQASAAAGDPIGQLIVDGGIDVRNMTMPVFCRRLTGFMGRVVLDQTGLNGQYDFKLRIKIEGLDQSKDALASSSNPDTAKVAVFAALNDWTSSSIFTDIQTQLGLKLEAGKAPVDNLVVDHVEPPSEN